MFNSDQTNQTPKPPEMSPMPDGLMEYLYPDLIYRFNQMFISAWKQNNIGRFPDIDGETAFFTLSYFNSYTRAFNWVSIGRKLWDPNSSESENAVEELKNILKMTKQKKSKVWNKLWNDFPEGSIYNSAKCVCKNLDFSVKPTELHHSMLGLYSGLQFQEEINVEGIFVRHLKRFGNDGGKGAQMNYISGKLENNNPCLLEPPFDWFKIDSSEYESLKTYQNIRNPSLSSNRPKREQPNRKKSADKQQGLQGLSEELLGHMLIKPERLNEEETRMWVVLVPIYDIWLLRGDSQVDYNENPWRIGNILLDSRGVGRIRAVVTCLFRTEKERDRWLDEKLSKLFNYLSEITSAISESSKAQALSQPITPPYDLLRHFISVLTYVQDWESAYVVDTTKDELEDDYISFCYKRKKRDEDDSPIVDWKEDEVERNNIHFPCDTSTIQCDGNKNFIWWTTDLWSKELIFSLEDEQVNAFSRFAIRFEFPKACYIPADTEIQKQMRNAYLRQQLELMNSLIPKVQTRRAALRSAVSAIMGRNMSHNIGSHVIARYAAVVGSAEEQREKDPERSQEDHRTVFLRYLQRRMDFIAEVSTSDKPNWSQPLGLVEILAALDFEKAKGRINEEGESKFKPILLSYITGKEGIKASVHIDPNTQEYFNCPSGEVGAHALYVILENIIRNSARHNTDFGEVVKLKVEATDSEYPELLKLEITDCQTEKEEECGESLDEQINNIISNESFLKPDGSPNPQYWGIREMQICAQHLRGLPLSDLEAPLSVGPPVLEATKKPENGESRLAYKLYLQRPKLCAIVTDKICDLLREDEILKKVGIALFNDLPEDLTELRGYGFVVMTKDRDQENKLSDKRLLLPVRTLYLEEYFIENLLSDIGSWVEGDNKFEPEKLLDHLHRCLWEHRYKRNCWKDKDIKALVGWDPSNWPEGNEREKDVHSFFHAHVDDTPYNDWGGQLGKKNQLGVVWVDHANSERFNLNKNPNLISAAKNFDRSRDKRPQPIIFSETFGSISRHKPVLEEQMRGQISGDELIAAALARVIILDERVQSLVDKEHRGIPYNILWPCMGIWTPTTSQSDLNNPDFESIYHSLNNPTEKSEQLPADFLVLHLTILENLSRRNEETAQEILNKFRGCTGVGKDCEVVIVSGRGVPFATINSDIEKTETEKALNERFLPISALLEHISQPSKLALMRSLWSA